jgi:catalase
VVHARRAGAYGWFQRYESLAEYTRADFLADPDRRTPVFVCFSTVAGFRGSADTVGDVRGFAARFYTREGNYDLVGNNNPVFFIRDGIKFPTSCTRSRRIRTTRSRRPPPRTHVLGLRVAAAGGQPHGAEATHMVLWTMSDRALPRSYRMIQGFGVHTFRFVNAEGRGPFVKFHWRPLLGVHLLVWEEAQAAAGKDPDLNRRDLWEAIESGDHPQWELGVQLVAESDEFAFDVDLLDATKDPPGGAGAGAPDRADDAGPQSGHFFAETEQIAFHTADVVPGIDFTNDPLLQAATSPTWTPS